MRAPPSPKGGGGAPLLFGVRVCERVVRTRVCRSVGPTRCIGSHAFVSTLSRRCIACDSHMSVRYITRVRGVRTRADSGLRVGWMQRRVERRVIGVVRPIGLFFLVLCGFFFCLGSAFCCKYVRRRFFFLLLSWIVGLLTMLRLLLLEENFVRLSVCFGLFNREKHG